MKEIELTQGQVALVDDEDFEPLSKTRWRALVRPDGTYYAYTDVPIAQRKKRETQEAIYMHRVIMSATKGVDVDHIDGNKLNNQKSNLRLCSRSENLANQRIRSDNTTGYKGVWVNSGSRKNPFCAEIRFEKRKIRLGSFRTAGEAAKAYNQTAIELHGEFARLNIIEGEE